MNANDIIRLFNALFQDTYNTRLRGGFEEPFYQAAKAGEFCHQIQFKGDYVSSALHEISHWCIAGPARRQQDDYGYWYRPNRNECQQQLFQNVEARPQALEWILSRAARVEFRVSCDNLDNVNLDKFAFRLAILQEVTKLLKKGLPPRAKELAIQLSRLSGETRYLLSDHYKELPL